MDFIYCFDEEKYEELLSRGFTLIHKFKNKDKYVYVFENDGLMTFRTLLKVYLTLNPPFL